MTLFDRLLVVVSSLGEIFLACVPIYFVLCFLDNVTSKLSAKFILASMNYFDNKLLSAQQAEANRWADKFKDL